MHVSDASPERQYRPAPGILKPSAIGHSSARINSIQTLRAIAALMVVVYHIIKECGPYMSIPAFEDWAYSLQFGVDLFFVISGFIMIYITKDLAGGIGIAGAFFAKRLLRVAPLYWATTVLAGAMIMLQPASLHQAYITTSYVIASLLFIPWPSPGSVGMTPLMGLGWTLLYEVLFYLLVAVVLASATRHRLVVLFGIVTIGVFAGFLVSREELPQIWYWTRPIMLEFLFGALIGHVFVKKIFLPKNAICAASIVIGIAIWQLAALDLDVYSPDLRGFSFAIPAALIVYGAVNIRPFRSNAFVAKTERLFQLLGDASFSLYMTHMFALRLLTIAMARILPGYTFISYAPLAIIFSCLIAIVVHRTLEKPSYVWGARAMRLHAPVNKFARAKAAQQIP